MDPVFLRLHHRVLGATGESCPHESLSHQFKSDWTKAGSQKSKNTWFFNVTFTSTFLKGGRGRGWGEVVFFLSSNHQSAQARRLLLKQAYGLGLWAYFLKCQFHHRRKREWTEQTLQEVRYSLRALGSVSWKMERQEETYPMNFFFNHHEGYVSLLEASNSMPPVTHVWDR